MGLVHTSCMYDECSQGMETEKNRRRLSSSPKEGETIGRIYNYSSVLRGMHPLTSHIALPVRSKNPGRCDDFVFPWLRITEPSERVGKIGSIDGNGLFFIGIRRHQTAILKPPCTDRNYHC